MPFASTVLRLSPVEELAEGAAGLDRVQPESMDGPAQAELLRSLARVDAAVAALGRPRPSS